MKKNSPLNNQKRFHNFTIDLIDKIIKNPSSLLETKDKKENFYYQSIIKMFSNEEEKKIHEFILKNIIPFTKTEKELDEKIHYLCREFEQQLLNKLGKDKHETIKKIYSTSHIWEQI